jgi:DNA-binding transcriptional MerR regulator
MHPKF